MAQPAASPATALSAATPNGHALKRRAACDECRTKKLRCTGEQPTCVRCARENITCVYSPQKQMGRPKKRPRTEDDLPSPRNKTSSHSPRGAWGPARALSVHGTGDESFNIGRYESAFTPGGIVQPWMQNGTDWNGDYSIPEGGQGRNYGGSDSGMPGLTPDNGSSHSPPLLTLPPELRTHHLNSISLGQTSHSDSSPLLDPALAGHMSGGLDTAAAGANLGLPPTLMPNCACLSSMYLTLNTLQGMDAQCAFPFALHPLREAMSTASIVLSCKECPTRYITAIQNTQLVGTLLLSTAERFSKILEHITSESARASLANETKKFRLADLNTSTSHLHTGGLGCVAAFNLDLTADEWRKFCKKVVRAEVFGPESGNECCCYFMGVVKQMEDRQERWHKSAVPEDFPRDETGQPIGGPRATIHKEDEHEHESSAETTSGGIKKNDHLCLKMVNYARKLVDGYDWS